MPLISRRSKLSGIIKIPGSKSHTIRAIAAASMANGESKIMNPLISSDTVSAINAYRAFGAEILNETSITIKGVSGIPTMPDNVIDLHNSGTTLYIAMGTAALINSWTILTGDNQLRNRPAEPLMNALNGLGAEVISAKGNGNPPIMIRGPINGGKISIDGSKTSQYLTSLLMNCPFALNDTEISVSNLVERPYIDMTLNWLKELGVVCKHNDEYSEFHIPGSQTFMPFRKSIPGDFSSASFIFCAAAITKSKVEIYGLDLNDTQGDKGIIDILTAMGVKFESIANGGICVTGGYLTGGEFDLSDMPDTLPVLAATACYAEGKTKLFNVAQARLKETDRIKVMCEELFKLGANIRELPDGLEIEGNPLFGAKVSGHDDHRVTMALAVAGLGCDDWVQVDSVESIDVTFPGFIELMQGAGAEIGKEIESYGGFSDL